MNQTKKIMEERHAERDRITHDKLVYRLCQCVCEIYEKEKEADPAVEEFFVYISSIEAFGYSEYLIRQVAKEYDIEIDNEDYDPDFPEESKGSLKFTSEKYEELKRVMEGKEK